MKPLIAVISARHRTYWREAARETWIPMLKADGRADALFFQGKEGRENPPVVEDEVILSCNDTYYGLPDKVRETVRWALSNGYDHMLKCDDDTILNPTPLLDSIVDPTSSRYNFDFVGRANRHPTNSGNLGFWVPMGFNYWLSQKSMEIVANSELPHRFDKDNDDERWVSEVLHQHNIDLTNDFRYCLYYGASLRPQERRINRPLRRDPEKEFYPGTFAFSVFMEGLSGETVPLHLKLEAYRDVFQKKVSRVQPDARVLNQASV